MKNYIDNILLAALIAVISLGVIALYSIYKDGPKPMATSALKPSNLNIYPYKYPSAAADYHNYDMAEPFAANVPFEFTPAAWMQMMNDMQITQMMHQMAAMPTQMMNPSIWMNTQGMWPNQSAGTVQQPMSPKEYKKWYEQQQKLQQSTK